MTKHVRKCGKCHCTSQDIQIDPHAWDGWNLGMKDTCPECQEREIASRPAPNPKVTGSRVFSTSDYMRSL